MPAKLTTEGFIEKAIAKHGNDYSYEKVDYKGAHEKITIICPKHQGFQQTPNNHLRGQGCSDCGFGKSANIRRSNAATFIKQANIKHKNKYSYKKVVYGQNTREKVTIICPTHQEFQQSPFHHLRGRGCRKCFDASMKSDTATFIKQANIKHKNKYSYKKVVYGQNTREKVTIICPTHQEFQQSPFHHLRGNGCPTCKNKTQAEITKKLISHFPNYEFVTGLKPKFLDGLEYDISTTLNNGIGVAIEYDGRQHYEPVQFGGMSMKKADANFKTQKVRDRKKNRLSKANGIHLFRIPYYEYDIKEDKDEDKSDYTDKDKDDNKGDDILYEIITQIEELEEYGHGYEKMEDVA